MEVFDEEDRPPDLMLAILSQALLFFTMYVSEWVICAMKNGLTTHQRPMDLRLQAKQPKCLAVLAVL